MIKAECHSDDMKAAYRFDAVPYFRQATDQAIIDLASCNWGGDYPADDVAYHMLAIGHQNVTKMFAYLEIIRNSEQDAGFECHVDAQSAILWIKEHKPDLLSKVLASMESETDTTSILDANMSKVHWDSDPSWSGNYEESGEVPGLPQSACS